MRRAPAFLLSREWFDADDGVEIILWARAAEAPVRVRIPRQEAVMFVPRDVGTYAHRRAERPLRTFDGRPVDALYFRSQRALLDERDRLRAAGKETLESDVKPSDRFVMERFVTGGMTIEGPCHERRGVLHFDGARVKAADFTPSLSLLSLDIETDDLDGPLLSAAIAMAGHEKVWVKGEPETPDERALLRTLFEAIVAADPDILCGWNVVEFDLTVLERRARELGVPFAVGRNGERARIVPPSAPGRASIARIPGRVVLDGMATLRTATYWFESRKLENVARELLGRGKKIEPSDDPLGEIRRMFREDRQKLAEYNLEDCRLVLDIFAKTDLVAFAVERARLTGLPMDRQGGSVAAFDHLYLPRVHRKGFVARDVDSDVEVLPSPGGHVLDSVPGLHRDVLSFDFRSLYPSIIRTFAIDPLRLAQPDVEGAILPELVTSLHEARTRALAANDAPLARAIKILMNSFYGVLGTPGCRFFDPRLPTAITTRGHEIIARAKRFFEERGFTVIYGDTDSLFVAGADPAAGPELAATLTALLEGEIRAEHGLESQLELRFESHYLRFLMPTTRDAERGSKKRYAGLARRPEGSTELVLRGLEAVRRDWSPLARRVQKELIRRVFADEPFEEWLLELVRDLRAGKLDAELGDLPRDYDLVIEKQLAPVSDVVLPFLDTSFAKVAGAQTSMF